MLLGERVVCVVCAGLLEWYGVGRLGAYDRGLHELEKVLFCRRPSLPRRRENRKGGRLSP